MDFVVSEKRIGSNFVASNTCYLIRNNWDDFGFKTMFEVVLFDGDASRIELGFIRIMEFDMPGGYVSVPSEFEMLDEKYCSLGNDRNYYMALAALPLNLRRNYLTAIRDCAFNQKIFDAFRTQLAMKSSLLREASPTDVRHSYPRILRGDSSLTPYRFSFLFQSTEKDGIERCAFEVRPDSRPPTNIHVLIGRNGVGKTRLLAGMADALTNNQAASIGMPGRFEFDPQVSGPNEFLNLVIVSFSAFDRFDPIPAGRARTDSSLPYYYVGIKAELSSSTNNAPARTGIKTPEDMNDEFASSMSSIIADAQKLERWMDAIRILSSDPGIAEVEAERLLFSGSPDARQQIGRAFALMSSGHKIVLLTMTRLVETVSDRSLVLMDEPETHLHPPLLGSFIRALSELLASRNGVAIVATHSPVVLQEVPASCVSMLLRSGQSMRVIRPDDETFAENVSVLTRKVFGLEVEQSGFYKLLRDASPGVSFDTVMDRFGQQIGSEGRALTRAFVVKGD